MRTAIVHFDDLDAFGMLHNSRYGVMVERAWISYWQQGDTAFSPDRFLLEDGCNVTKELKVEFDVPVDKVGEYGVHLWVERRGRTSLTYGFRLCSADDTVTYAHGHRVIVRLDRGTLRPAAWSDRAKPLIDGLLRPDDL
ncbi:thioesterase [Streptomyces tsukubensis]|uniref:Thioesterase n=1 Tax=Streptomyces tsukubensis TaxID=83656 RepID=A0A1V4A8L8_9ACTN|nr:thioesterase [Streptomyces tsukubensis]